MLKQPYEKIGDLEKFFPSLYGKDYSEQKNRYEKAFEKFKSLFGVNAAYVASSSGRVEVIGNHTDHNGGRVISCAISLDSLAFFLPDESGVIRVVSEGYKDIVVDTVNFCGYKQGTSSALVCGVVAWLKENGYKAGGFKAYVTSNVCGGAGISSSASFEVLICEILNFLYNDGKLTPEQKAIASQYAENVYFGKPCGLLDQSAIAYGGLKKLDFSEKGKIQVTEINSTLSDYSLILINTGGSHADLTDEYAAVPAEMFSVAKAFGKNRLIELDENDFFNGIQTHCKGLSDRAVCRSVHFYEENARVDRAEKALNEDDYGEFLSCINESGASSLWKLQNCFVSGSREQPIPRAIALTGRLFKNGANRVHGGGFAGCILNVVKNDEAEEFVRLTEKYYAKENVIVLHVRSVGTIVL